MPGSLGNKEVPSNLLHCPGCEGFELPEPDIYQCREGHLLCRGCYFKNSHCLKCTDPLNRYLPSHNENLKDILGDLTTQCPFRIYGCEEKMKRKDVESHQLKCFYNLNTFGKLVNICETIGFPDCGFKLNNGNTTEAVAHLVSEHRCILTTSDKFIMELAFFQQIATSVSAGTHFWTPVMVDLKEQNGFLLPMIALNKSNASFTFLSVFLPYPTNDNRKSFELQMEYRVGGNDSKIWSESLNSIEKAHEQLSSGLRFDSYAPAFLCNCSESGSLFIECKVKGQRITSLPNERSMTEKNVCTNLNNLAQIASIIAPTVKLPFGFNRSGGSPFEKYFNGDIPVECDDKSFSLPTLRELFEGDEAADLKGEDMGWLKTALIFHVALRGSVEDLKYIIDKGVEFTDVEVDGILPLHLTMLDKYKKVGLEKAKLLVDLGRVDVRALAEGNLSTLHFAARKGNAEALEYFLRKGVEVNGTDDSGRTPLHVAVLNEDEEEGVKIAQVLLGNGADPGIRDKNCKSPFELAVSKGKDKIRKLIISHYFN